ncbi:MAG: hypothetical protein M1827_002052 [Pycnora praestabilis]|nr:MAG: hypothetical protein M1827_002052 [Pycnora praestabilis]
MVMIEPFGVEQVRTAEASIRPVDLANALEFLKAWMDEYETTAKYNIAETCSASVSVNDLKAFSTDKSKEPLSLSSKLVYGAIRGSENLRANIAELYSALGSLAPSPNDVLVTPGAIAANFLLFYTLIGPGDHVVCHFPTYQQLYSVPKSLGAEVSRWEALEDNDWIPDVNQLKALIRPNTKLIVVNNPNNPTGASLRHSLLQEIVDIAREHDIFVLSDEVYRPLFHSLPASDLDPPSILTTGYCKTIATGSLSKAFALAGLRIGWIASCDHNIIEACAQARDYTTICVSMIDDQLATYALSQEVVRNLLNRNMALARANLGILSDFIDEHPHICKWVKPNSATTAFVRFERDGIPIDDVVFCQVLQKEAGVMFCPGSYCFGDGKQFKGYVRMGYVCETDVLLQGLQQLRKFLETYYRNIPAAS